MDKVEKPLLGVVWNPIAQIIYCEIYTGAKLKYKYSIWIQSTTMPQ